MEITCNLDPSQTLLYELAGKLDLSYPWKIQQQYSGR
jgi:hypothetical protein